MKYIQKDITTVERGVVAHGVNCQGVMGSGVAKAIRDKWPTVYELYKRTTIGNIMLGSCHIVTVAPNLYVCNCYTQQFYGKGGRFASPKAVKDSLTGAYEWAEEFKLPLYLPKIGAGLGGLSWEREVEPIVKDLQRLYPEVETYICVIGEDNV